MYRNVRNVDADTGELLPPGRMVYLVDRPKLREGWVMTFQTGLLKLATDKTMTQQQLRVLLYLMGRLDFENFIHVPQVDIARELEMQAPNVSAAVTALVRKGILVRGPKVGRVTTLRLADTLGWKGRVRSLQEERKRRLTLIHNQTHPRTAPTPPKRS
jgi:DNA-binding MarR family transcriptional regulator